MWQRWNGVNNPQYPLNTFGRYNYRLHHSSWRAFIWHLICKNPTIQCLPQISKDYKLFNLKGPLYHSKQSLYHSFYVWHYITFHLDPLLSVVYLLCILSSLGIQYYFIMNEIFKCGFKTLYIFFNKKRKLFFQCPSFDPTWLKWQRFFLSGSNFIAMVIWQATNL